MNDTIELIALVVALALAIVDEVRGHGQDLTAWAVILIAAVLLFSRLV